MKGKKTPRAGELGLGRHEVLGRLALKTIGLYIQNRNTEDR